MKTNVIIRQVRNSEMTRQEKIDMILGLSFIAVAGLKAIMQALYHHP